MESQRNRKQISGIEQILFKDALLGLTAMNQDLVLLNYGPIVIRKDYKTLNTVKILSGGTASYDLSFASFVGKGLLTACVMDYKQSPYSRLISHVIQELNLGEPNYGVIVIAQVNSELFNFGLAAERTNSCGVRVKLLALNDNKCEGIENNTCGVILAAKILSGLAEKNGTYDDLLQMFQKISNCIVTVSLQYKEQGDSTEVTKTSLISEKSKDDLHLQVNQAVAVLINVNIGMTEMVKYSLIKRVVEELSEAGVYILRIYGGNLFRLDNHVATLTVLTFNEAKVLDCLDMPTKAPGWQQISQFLPRISLDNEIPGGLKRIGKQPIELKGPKVDEKYANIIKVATQFACDALISCEKQLNIMDQDDSVGATVGNIGTRLKNASEYINKRLRKEKFILTCPYAYLKKLGIVIEMSVGGNMGSVYGLIFEAAADTFGETPENEDVTSVLWFKALSAARAAVKRYCSEKMETTTLYCPIRTCELVVSSELEGNMDYLYCFGKGVAAAEEAAREAKQPNGKYADAGAHAVGIWMRAVYEAVRLFAMGGLTR